MPRHVFDSASPPRARLTGHVTLSARKRLCDSRAAVNGKSGKPYKGRGAAELGRENDHTLHYAGAVGGHQRGQTLIEFALTILAFLLVLFGALSSALYAVQRSAAVTAAAAGVRAAGSARADSPNDPDLAAAAPIVTDRMSPVLFGTTLTA